MRVWTSVAVLGAVVAAAGALTVVALGRAQERGRKAHCRNNLRFLAQEAWQVCQLEAEWRQEKLGEVVRELGIEVLPPPEGRGFWYQVLLARFTTSRRQEDGTRKVFWQWEVIQGPIPFICPLRQGAARDWRSVESIDYRGPVRYPESWDAAVPWAADRFDNHPDGTVTVLWADLSVDEMDKLHASVRAEGAKLSAVRGALEQGTRE